MVGAVDAKMNEIQFSLLEAHKIMRRQTALTRIQATH